jgi:hypothetical protein
MDFAKAFSYVFEDPDWVKKVLIAALILIIPIIGELVVLGWSLRIAKNVMDGESTPLPEVDFGTDLARGFMAFVIGFVYTLPAILLSGFLGTVNAILANGSNSNTFLTASVVVTSCFGLVSALYGIVVTVVLPAAYTNFLAKGNLGAGFELGEVFGMVRNNLGAFLIVFLGSIVAGLIAGLGLIACIIGVVATSAYSSAILGHLYGQAYRVAHEPLPEVV